MKSNNKLAWLIAGAGLVEALTNSGCTTTPTPFTRALVAGAIQQGVYSSIDATAQKKFGPEPAQQNVIINEQVYAPVQEQTKERKCVIRKNSGTEETYTFYYGTVYNVGEERVTMSYDYIQENLPMEVIKTQKRAGLRELENPVYIEIPKEEVVLIKSR